MVKAMHRELAKDMEKKFWADLQERLDEVKQKPLALYIPATGNVVEKPAQG